MPLKINVGLSKVTAEPVPGWIQDLKVKTRFNIFPVSFCSSVEDK